MSQQLIVQGRALNDNLRSVGNFTDKDIRVGKQPSTQLPQFASVAVEDVLDEAPADRGPAADQGVRLTMNASGLPTCAAKAGGFSEIDSWS